MPKGSTPWSTRTIAEGGTDSPVGDLVPVPDSAQPVINAGFIDDSGKWQLAAAADDRAFTFQDPAQALAAGADMEFPVDMLNHDKMIFAILDSSENNINVDLFVHNPTTVSGPYTPFADIGIDGDKAWKINNPDTVESGYMRDILRDVGETLAAVWQFYKVEHLRGTQIKFLIHSNEASDAGTISTAYLRLV